MGHYLACVPYFVSAFSVFAFFVCAFKRDRGETWKDQLGQCVVWFVMCWLWLVIGRLVELIP